MMTTEVRRIVLALEQTGLHPSVVRMALRLARRHSAELAGLLLENINLLQAAALPFTREITLHGEERELEPETLGLQLHRLAEEMRQELTRQAGALGMRLEFRTLRGAGMRTLVEASGDAALVIAGRPPSRRWGIAVARPRIVLLASGAPAFTRAHDLALAMLEDEVASPDMREAADWLMRPWPKTGETLTELRGENPSLIVAVGSQDGEGGEVLEALLGVSECPVVLMR